MSEQTAKTAGNPLEFYPRWVRLKEGDDPVLVKDHLQHSALAGKTFNERAEEIPDEAPKPPTFEEVLAKGYDPKAADVIVAEEAKAASFGLEPYGDKPRTRENLVAAGILPAETPAGPIEGDPLGKI